MFITSDQHFDHDKQFLWGRDRGFKNVEEMNDCLMDSWNSTVSKKDTVHVVGDFAFTTNVDRLKWLIRNLNGNIIFTRGNHDSLFCKRGKVQRVFDGKIDHIPYVRNVKYNGQKFMICHFEMLKWDRSQYGAYHFFGHAHNRTDEQPALKMEIGVDTNNFKPWSIDRVFELMNKKAEKLEEWSKLDPVLRSLLTVKLIDGEYSIVERKKPENRIKSLIKLNAFFLRRFFT